MAANHMNPAHAGKQELLQRAATFVECHALSKPLIMGSGKNRLLLRVSLPLKLRVHDHITGELLVESADGDMFEVSDQFLRSLHNKDRGRP